MRVLTTTMCYPTTRHPDQGIFVQRRAIALAQHAGAAISVVSPQPWCPLLRTAPGDSLQGPLAARYPRMTSVPVLGWALDGLAFARAVECDVISETIRGRRPDVIDAHFEYPDGVGAWIAGRRLGIPVVVTVRGKIVSLSRKTIRRMQIAWMLRGVAARIAVSRSLAEWVHRIGGSDLDVQVIPNGIDRDVFHSVDRLHARQSLHWDPAARYVLAVGHQQFVKGFDRLLDAIPHVRTVLPDVRFVLIGSDRGEAPFRAKLHETARAINSDAPADAPIVQILPAATAHTLNLMYNAADLLASTSRSEGWCNAIAESLACGTPVLATNVGGNAEQINASHLGRIVTDAEPAPLAAAVVDALHQAWDRDAVSATGSARTWSEVARQTISVLTRAAHQPPLVTHAAGVTS